MINEFVVTGVDMYFLLIILNIALFQLFKWIIISSHSLFHFDWSNPTKHFNYFLKDLLNLPYLRYKKKEVKRNGDG